MNRIRKQFFTLDFKMSHSAPFASKLRSHGPHQLEEHWSSRTPYARCTCAGSPLKFMSHDKFCISCAHLCPACRPGLSLQSMLFHVVFAYACTSTKSHRAFKIRHEIKMFPQVDDRRSLRSNAIFNREGKISRFESGNLNPLTYERTSNVSLMHWELGTLSLGRSDPSNTPLAYCQLWTSNSQFRSPFPQSLQCWLGFFLTHRCINWSLDLFSCTIKVLVKSPRSTIFVLDTKKESCQVTVTKYFLLRWLPVFPWWIVMYAIYIFLKKSQSAGSSDR